jgi:hypothetical protein
MLIHAPTAILHHKMIENDSPYIFRQLLRRRRGREQRQKQERPGRSPEWARAKKDPPVRCKRNAGVGNVSTAHGEITQEARDRQQEEE